MIKKQVIDYLLSKSGNLDSGETWYHVGKRFGKSLRYRKVLSQFGSTKWMHTNFGSGSPGLSLEVFMKNSNIILKEDVFFHIENESNTGIDL